MDDVIGYARISSTAVKKGAIRIEGENNSIEVQIKNITEYCKFKNLNLKEILIDEDISGGTEFATRPGGKKAMWYLSQGVKTIVATKVDRMFRDTSDALLTVKDFNKREIDVHYSDMGGATFSTKTAVGRLIFTMVVANAEFEKDTAGERTNGQVYCSHLLGFDNIEGKLVPNPKEQEIIQYIKSSELNPAQLAFKLNDMGYRAKKGGKFFRSTVQNIIENPIYNS